MKRLLLIALLLLPATAFAQAADRAVLLAADGALYTVETRISENAGAASSRYLLLTVQDDDKVTKSEIPASLSGNNWRPELAYDDESQTLFVFWLHSQNYILGTSELLFCSYQKGKWNASASIDNVPYHFRYNLRVGVTRTVTKLDSDGTWKVIPGLTVHAAWWDESGYNGMARYAMLTVEHGLVKEIALRDLVSFINRVPGRAPEVAGTQNSLLRQPFVFESPTKDTVDVVFGDAQTNSLYRVTLKPMDNTRVRIPIGVKETSYPGPPIVLPSDAQKVGSISTTPERVLIHYVSRGSLRYLMYEGQWTSKAIALSDDVSAETALAALRKMVNGD